MSKTVLSVSRTAKISSRLRVSFHSMNGASDPCESLHSSVYKLTVIHVNVLQPELKPESFFSNLFHIALYLQSVAQEECYLCLKPIPSDSSNIIYVFQATRLALQHTLQNQIRPNVLQKVFKRFVLGESISPLRLNLHFVPVLKSLRAFESHINQAGTSTAPFQFNFNTEIEGVRN